jgi:Holliday junction DNA helicase RuvA
LIGRLTGKVAELDANLVLLDVNGVGYEVEASASVLHALPGMGEIMSVYTHFVVREDAQLLYGFSSRGERELFRAFIKISGVGPKLALALISATDLSSLHYAVRHNDLSLLTRVPGIGKKTAERVMLELKNRLDTLTDSGAVPLSVVSVDTSSDALEAEQALVALGYRPVDASRAVHRVIDEMHDDALPVRELVRLALRTFAQTGSSR